LGDLCDDRNKDKIRLAYLRHLLLAGAGLVLESTINRVCRVVSSV
jgi:hypothetical protein